MEEGDLNQAQSNFEQSLLLSEQSPSPVKSRWHKEVFYY